MKIGKIKILLVQTLFIIMCFLSDSYGMDESDEGYESNKYTLATIYLSETKVKADPKRAIKLLEKDAKKGREKSLKLLTNMAEKGNSSAQYALGKVYCEKKNKEKADRYFKNAARQGRKRALAKLRESNKDNDQGIFSYLSVFYEDYTYFPDDSKNYSVNSKKIDVYFLSDELKKNESEKAKGEIKIYCHTAFYSNEKEIELNFGAARTKNHLEFIESISAIIHHNVDKNGFTLTVYFHEQIEEGIKKEWEKISQRIRKMGVSVID